MAGELGKNMDMVDFIDLVNNIMANHSGIKGRCIKYIRPHFDTRTGDFYGVTFDGLRGEHDFFVVNEHRQKDLFKWIMEWLASDPKEDKDHLQMG
jgi:hypothetical protein